MSNRYHNLFKKLADENRGAFVPFTVLGDPNPKTSLKIARTLVNAGADALELGIAFSDPVADGPTIQNADARALAAGVKPEHAFSIIQALRQEFANLPIGLLVYANLVCARGISEFYREAARVGVDSVLIADVPIIEASPFAAAAKEHHIAPVLIATPNSSNENLKEIASLGQGYTYVVTRAGVTGVKDGTNTNHSQLLSRLKGLGAPPCLLGFGISKPEQVRMALEADAAGAISGSAVVNIIAENLEDEEKLLMELQNFVVKMKEATSRVTSL